MLGNYDKTSLRVLWELGKLRGLLRSLNVTISQSTPERSVLRSELEEVSITLSSLRTYLKQYVDEIQLRSFLDLILLAQDPQKRARLYPQDLFKQLFSSPKVPENEFESLFSILNSTLVLLDHAKDLPDSYFKERVGEILPRLSSLLALIESSLEIPLHTVAKVSELIGAVSRWGMGERWAVATCYLTALEVVVNRKLKELSIESGDKPFKERFRQLVEALSQKGIDLGELEKRLPEVFWDLRNRVVHGGLRTKRRRIQYNSGVDYENN